jgi:uncharacterized coiled-coil protein SlyX
VSLSQQTNEQASSLAEYESRVRVLETQKAEAEQQIAALQDSLQEQVQQLTQQRDSQVLLRVWFTSE